MILLAIPKACMNHLGPYLEVCLGCRVKASTLNPFGTIWELRKLGGGGTLKNLWALCFHYPIAVLHQGGHWGLAYLHLKSQTLGLNLNAWGLGFRAKP